MLALTPVAAASVVTATALLAGLGPAPRCRAAPGARRGVALPQVARQDAAPVSTTSTCAAPAPPTAAQKSGGRRSGGAGPLEPLRHPGEHLDARRATWAPPPSSNAVTAARAWLGAHADLFGLSAAQIDGLDLVSASRSPAATPARCCSARTSAAPPPRSTAWSPSGSATARSSTSPPRSPAPRRPRCPARDALRRPAAWLKAAAERRPRRVSGASISEVTTRLGWTRFKVAGFAQEQQVRLRSLALADGTVRPVFEANVVDAQGGSATAYTLAGRRRQRQGAGPPQPGRPAPTTPIQFQGTVTATACGPKHQFEVKDANTKQIVATAAEAVTTNDIVVKIFNPAGDAARPPATPRPAPRSRRTAPTRSPQGIYSMQVCPFQDPTVPFTGAGRLRRRRDHQRPGRHHRRRRRAVPAEVATTSRPTRRSTTRPTTTPTTA